jgi:Ca2+-binding EF-hand superfamily protein
VKRFNKYATNETMNLDQYKTMMGVLGNTFLTDRMFLAMDTDGDKLIDLDEYLTYNDIITHGSVKEKRDQNFNMLNDNKDLVVSYEEFENFVIQILDMYSRTVSEKINANKDMIKEIFNKIAKHGKSSFTFDDYVRALDNDPNLFIWLEKPKEMLNQILNESEANYSKQFVDNTLDLLFRYISTTEYAMKQIIN